MSHFLRVFCRSREPITRREIVDFIRDGQYFEKPRFEPPPEAAELEEEDWTPLKVYYEENRRPLIFARSAEDQLFRDEIEETIDDLDEAEPANMRQEIIQKLKMSRQTIAIEVFPADASDDCWEMLDNLEGYLARKCDGIIYAPGEGFYDQRLQLILKRPS
jgi:hypothetical protein